MAFSTTEKVNGSDKLALQITGTADDSPGPKWWYSENFPWKPIVDPDTIWVDFSSIPGAANGTAADAAVTANPTILEKRKVHLTADPTSNNRAYLARWTYGDNTSPMFGAWIQPSLVRNSGDASWGYAIRLYNGDPDGGGTELSTTYHGGASGAPSWKFSYSSGIIGVSTDERDHYSTLDLWIVGYRYIGPTGVGGSTPSENEQDVVFPITVQVGHPVYISGNRVGSNWTVDTANPEDESKMPAIGLVIEKTSPTSGKILTGGEVVDFSGSLVVGSDYFVDYGGLRIGPPPAGGGGYSMAQHFGHAVASDKLLITGSLHMIKRR